MPLPREHGAWSILAQPFLCALILAREWHWSILAAAVAVAAMFLLRTPLVILGRQAFVWREPHAESRSAFRWALLFAAVTLAAAAILLPRWGIANLLGFGIAATALTAMAVYMEITNRQRSVWLQLVTAAGLSSSCLAAVLSAKGQIPRWGWILWMLCAAHAIAGILVVRARLEVRIAARSRKAEAPIYFQPARLAQLLLIAAGLVMLASGSPWIGAALILPSLLHLRELGRLAATIDMPLQTVGLRAMSVSIGFSILAICGLWPA